MIKQLKFATLAVVLACLLIAPAAQVYAVDFDQNRIIDDVVFNQVDSMNAAQIDDMLNARSSCISPNSGFRAIDPIGYNPTDGFLYGGNVTAGTVIEHAAKAYELNPQVIITTLQKEQSLITTKLSDSNCNTRTISKAMGYACTDSYQPNSYTGINLYTRGDTTYTSVDLTCVESIKKTGFTQQIIRAAWLLKYSQQRSLGNINWAIVKDNWDNSDDLHCYSSWMTEGWHQVCPSGPTNYYDGLISIDGSTVKPYSGATVALYRYTPHLSGNRNFVTIWTGWFGSPYAIYSRLDVPRWMEIKSSTQKYDIATGTPIEEYVDAGKHIYFPYKINIFGKTFLRTQYDTDRGYHKGILLSDVQDIPFVEYESPRYLRANKDFTKFNPVTGISDTQPIAAGTDLRVSSQITVNGNTYLRSEYDEKQAALKAVLPSWLSEITAENAVVPRYMMTGRQTGYVSSPASNPLQNTDGSLPNGRQIYITKRLRVAGKWFVATESSAQENKFIPLSDLQEISFGGLIEPRYMRLSNASKKVYPILGTTSNEPEIAAGTDLFITSKINVGGTTYFKTRFDTLNNNQLGIPSTSFQEIAFTPVQTPRYMQANTDIYKINPLTGEKASDPVIKKGQRIEIKTKIIVNSILYIRTAYDTNLGLTKAVTFSDLSEIK